MGRRVGIDGRELILAAALRLFAEQGIDAVSIRAVNREAGLGPASVHYHFGTKEALVDAVIHAYGEPVISSTKARAKEILEADSLVSARDLVTMLAEPYLDLMQAGPEGIAWVRVIAGLLQSDPGIILDRPSTRLTWNAASRIYPDASPTAVQRAMGMCFTLLVTQLAQTRRTGRRGTGVDVALLIDFLSAGLDAALRLPPNTASARGSRAS